MMIRSRLILGSWAAEVESDSDVPVRFLVSNFKQGAVNEAQTPATQAVLRFEIDSAAPQANDIPDDTMRVVEDAAGIRLTTPHIQASATRQNGSPHAFILLRIKGTEANVVDAHLTMVIRRLLLWLDLFYLHAGAVEWNGTTSLFIGEKGAGKSTCCLRVAAAGARLISEDHVLVKRSASQFTVSGAEVVGRVTAHTEQHLFPVPLAVEAQDYAGMQKKEFALATHFRCAPCIDFPFQNLFFPSVGEQFHLQPLSEMTAALRLMANARQFFRFQGAGDYLPFLDFFTGMVAGRQVYDLTLTPQLADLDQLVEHLDNA